MIRDRILVGVLISRFGDSKRPCLDVTSVFLLPYSRLRHFRTWSESVTRNNGLNSHSSLPF